MSKISRDQALAHFGVKGMRWGVRNEEELKGRKKSSKQSTYDKAVNEAKIAENKAKWGKKFEPPKKVESQSTKKGWRPTKKQLVIAGIGAAYIGLVIYGNYSNNSALQQFAELNNNAREKAQSFLKAGQACSASAYNKAVQGSISRSWGASGYIKESSFLQQGTTFAPGHVFHRISTGTETTFGNATYCTDSLADFNRYVAAFRHEKGNVPIHHISFRATQEIKIPSLTTTLDVLRQSLSSVKHEEITIDQAISYYRHLSGSDWDSKSNPVVDHFIKSLIQQGYHGLVDEMDAGVIGERPLVLFDKSRVSKKSSQLMTKAHIKASEAALTEIFNRK